MSAIGTTSSSILIDCRLDTFKRQLASCAFLAILNDSSFRESDESATKSNLRTNSSDYAKILRCCLLFCYLRNSTTALVTDMDSVAKIDILHRV